MMNRRHSSRITAIGLLLGLAACAAQSSTVDATEPLRLHDAAQLVAALQPAYAGTGNRLIIEGSLERFRRSNRAIEPLPAAGFFTQAH